MPDNREELKVYRLEMAKERLHSSKILLEAGSYKDSIGRSYYAMFTAVRALLAVEGCRSYCIFSERICEDRKV